MKKNLQKIIFSICLFTFFASANSSAQVVHTESFDANIWLPTGWTGVTSYTRWTRETAGFNPICAPHSGAAMARYNVTGAVAGTTQTIATPAIDLQGVTVNDTARFSLWIYRSDSLPTINDSLTIYVNTTLSMTGAEWLGSVARSSAIAQPDTQSGSGWYQYSFDIPASYTTATNYILISGTSQAGLRIYIDDCEWTSWQAVCNGTPDGGTVTGTDTVLCAPALVNFTLNTTSSGTLGISYQWSSGPSVTGPWTNFGANLLTANMFVTASTYFQCVVTCSSSGFTDTSNVFSVIVNPNPPPTVVVTPNQATYCNYGPPVMVVATGANSYTWVAPPGTLSSNVGDTVYATAPQMGGPPPPPYTVTGTDLFGCTATATVQITFHNTPIVIIDPHTDGVCAGDPVTLDANQAGQPLGGVTWEWFPNGETTQSITVPTPVTSTTFTVRGTSFYGCSTDTSVATTVVNGAAPIVAGFTYVINGNTVTFTNTSTFGATYVWDFGDGNSSFSQNPVYTYIGNNTYTVTLTVSYGTCSPVYYSQVIVVGFAGIQQIDGKSLIAVYPNPVLNKASIEFNLNVNNASLSIVNPVGQVVQQMNIVPVSGNHFMQEINFEGLESGIYFIQLKSTEGNFMQKITKE